MLTLVFCAGPGCAGASTATYGAYLASRVLDERRRVIPYSNAPHPEFLRRGVRVLGRARYGVANESDVALIDLSDIARPRTPGELLASWPGFEQAVLLPVLGDSPRALDFLRTITIRPILPLWTGSPEAIAVTSEGFRLPALEPETRLVLERGEAALGYTPRLDLRRWTAEWIQILSQVFRTYDRVQRTSAGSPTTST